MKIFETPSIQMITVTYSGPVDISNGFGFVPGSITPVSFTEDSLNLTDVGE